MILDRLTLTNFKNYDSFILECSPSINVIYGNNGKGKTNLLDAIHFLSFGKSHFHLSDNALVKDGEEFYRLEGSYHNEEEYQFRIAAKFKQGTRKTIEVNGKKVKQINELVGKIPVVLVAPDDLTIVHGGSKERRDFINRILCQSDKDYLDHLMKYNRLMRQKDALLKSDGMVQELEVKIYNDQLIPLAEYIHEKRRDKILLLSGLVQKHYGIISGGHESIDMVYVSQLNEPDSRGKWDEIIHTEIRSRRPLIGVQRDDLSFTISNKPFKKFGSQGQLKTLLYSLRMAEFFYLTDSIGTKPILLLDDYFEKLDQMRLSQLLKMINEDEFDQVFLTDTELSRSQIILDEHGIDYKAHHISNPSA